MTRNRFLPILLTATLLAQAVIAGWGHSHAHTASGSHSHVGMDGPSHSHDTQGHAPHERSPLPNHPTDQDDCSVCRHLALAAILTLELESPAIGDAVEEARQGASLLDPLTAIGLHRPRSPPALS